jgi:hypothetical protein
MTRANLTRAAFARYLASGELADAVTATWKDARLTGQAPVGVFGEVAEAGDRELLARWAADLDAAGGRGQRFRRFGLGPGPARRRRRHPAAGQPDHHPRRPARAGSTWSASATPPATRAARSCSRPARPAIASSCAPRSITSCWPPPASRPPAGAT